MSPALRNGQPFGGDGVTEQKAVVEKYTDGFRRGGPNPELTLDRLVEEDDTVAVIGHGSVSLGGDPHAFVYSEVFTFRGGLVSRLDTFHIWLRGVPE
jgi:hypothetical protein